MVALQARRDGREAEGARTKQSEQKWGQNGDEEDEDRRTGKTPWAKVTGRGCRQLIETIVRPDLKMVGRSGLVPAGRQSKSRWAINLGDEGPIIDLIIKILRVVQSSPVLVGGGLQ